MLNKNNKTHKKMAAIFPPLTMMMPRIELAPIIELNPPDLFLYNSQIASPNYIRQTSRRPHCIIFKHLSFI